MKVIRVFFLITLVVLSCFGEDIRKLKLIFNEKSYLYQDLQNNFDSYKDMDENSKLEYEDKMRDLINMEFLTQENIDESSSKDVYKIFAPYINFHSFFIARYLPVQEYIDAAFKLMSGVIKYNLNNDYMQTYVLLLARKGEYEAALDFFPKYLEENYSNRVIESYDLVKDLALRQAIVSNDVGTLQRLKEMNIDFNRFLQDDEQTPIRLAMGDKNTEESAKFLLNNGVDINISNQNESLLYNSVESYFSEDFINFLLSKGCNKNFFRDTIITNTGDNPYIYARVFRVGFYSKELLLNLRPNDYKNVDLAYSYLQNNLFDDLNDFIQNHSNVKDFEQEGKPNFLVQLLNKYIHNTYELSQKQKGKIIDIMKLLITDGADLNKTDEKNENSFENIISTDIFPKEFVTHALAYGNPNVKYYLKKQNVNWTSLFGAIYTKNQDAFDTLIIKGADVNYKDENGLDGFYLAVSTSQINMAKKLIEEGFKLDVNSYEKRTPLSIALLNNDTSMLDYLQELKFNIKDKVLNKKNLLEFALSPSNKDLDRLNHPLVINEQTYKYLFEHFKDELKNDKDINYLELLTLKSGKEAFEGLKILLNMKLIDLKNQKDKFSPLQFLADDEYLINKVELLANQQIDLNNQDQDGDTPLHQFVISYIYAMDDIKNLRENNTNKENKKVNYDVENILKIAGIDENKYMIEKKTASLQMYKLAIKYLSEKGVDLNIKNNENKTPLELAISGGINDGEILKYLHDKK